MCRSIADHPPAGRRCPSATNHVSQQRQRIKNSLCAAIRLGNGYAERHAERAVLEDFDPQALASGLRPSASAAMISAAIITHGTLEVCRALAQNEHVHALLGADRYQQLRDRINGLEDAARTADAARMAENRGALAKVAGQLEQLPKTPAAARAGAQIVADAHLTPLALTEMYRRSVQHALDHPAHLGALLAVVTSPALTGDEVITLVARASKASAGSQRAGIWHAGLAAAVSLRMASGAAAELTPTAAAHTVLLAAMRGRPATEVDRIRAGWAIAQHRSDTALTKPRKPSPRKNPS